MCVCVYVYVVGSSPYTVDPRDISMEEDAEAPLEIIQIEASQANKYMYTYNGTHIYMYTYNGTHIYMYTYNGTHIYMYTYNGTHIYMYIQLAAQVPGEGDFGDGVLVDNGPLPTLNWSGDSVAGGVGDYSSDSAGVGGCGERVGEGEGGEREEEEQGELDSVLLFDECTDSFQLFNGKEDEVQNYYGWSKCYLTLILLQHIRTDQHAPEAQGTPVLQPILDTNADPIQPSLAPRGRVGCRVRRRLAFDAEIKCESSVIKDNMATVQTTLRDKHTVSNRLASNTYHPCHAASGYIHVIQ